MTLDVQGKNSLQEAYPQEYQKYQQALQQGLQAGQTVGGATGGFPDGGQLPANIQIPPEIQAQLKSLTANLGFCGFSPNFGTSTQSSPKVGMTASLTVCLDVKAGTLSVLTRNQNRGTKRSATDQLRGSSGYNGEKGQKDHYHRA